MSEQRDKLTHRAEELRDQRASVAVQLKDVAAELWRDGLENVREIGRLTGLSRTTLYTALRERGIDPTDRVAQVPPSLIRMEQHLVLIRAQASDTSLPQEQREKLEQAIPKIEAQIAELRAAEK
jgi:DNA-binding phage protein